MIWVQILTLIKSKFFLKPDTFRLATSCAHRRRSSTLEPPTMAPNTAPPAYKYGLEQAHYWPIYTTRDLSNWSKTCQHSAVSSQFTWFYEQNWMKTTRWESKQLGICENLLLISHWFTFNHNKWSWISKWEGKVGFMSMNVCNTH